MTSGATCRINFVFASNLKSCGLPGSARWKTHRLFFESSATAGTPPGPGGSTYGYANVYPIVCLHCTRCSVWRVRPSRLPHTGDRLHPGVGAAPGTGEGGTAAVPDAPRPPSLLRGGTVTRPPGSTIVRPVGSGNDAC